MSHPVITTFAWVPPFARGFVRDLRPRWACEEMGVDYAERLISAVNRPADHYRDQPWGQVPVLRDGNVRLFESGAILLHLAEQDAALVLATHQLHLLAAFGFATLTARSSGSDGAWQSVFLPG